MFEHDKSRVEYYKCKYLPGKKRSKLRCCSVNTKNFNYNYKIKKYVKNVRNLRFPSNDIHCKYKINAHIYIPGINCVASRAMSLPW